MHVIPVASGKGGVGKSLIAANLAIALAQAGQRVVLADLDLGGSNLHLILGERFAGPSLGTFIGSKSEDFSAVVQATDTPGLRFIGGDAEVPGMANVTAGQRRSLVKRLTTLDADVLVADLGAGTSQHVIDYFLMSSHGIIVTTPAPTSTVNAYLFLKNVVFRLLQITVGTKGPGADYLKEILQDRSSLRRVYIPDIIRALEERDSDAARIFRDSLRRLRPRLIINMLEDPKDAEAITRLRRSCQQYLDLDPMHLGVVYRDDLQNTALSARIPIVRYKPNAILSQAIYRIAEKLLHLADDGQDDFIDLETINDSFDAAELEAETDFAGKLNYIEELLHSGALTQGDLVETIRSQHHEITQLRRQNALYKARIVAAMQQGFAG